MIGDFIGEETSFILTDLNGIILDIPAGTGPFDLDPAGPGTCVIWYIAFDTDLEGLEVGLNLDDLDGCFDLSNGLTVVSTSPTDSPLRVNAPLRVRSPCSVARWIRPFVSMVSLTR